jgi:hypothetical protein
MALWVSVSLFLKWQDRTGKAGLAPAGPTAQAPPVSVCGPQVITRSLQPREPQPGIVEQSLWRYSQPPKHNQHKKQKSPWFKNQNCRDRAVNSFPYDPGSDAKFRLLERKAISEISSIQLIIFP